MVKEIGGENEEIIIDKGISSWHYAEFSKLQLKEMCSIL